MSFSGERDTNGEPRPVDQVKAELAVKSGFLSNTDGTRKRRDQEDNNQQREREQKDSHS